MELQASWCKHTLKFKFTAGTSAGTLNEKVSYFIKLNHNKALGIGEIAPLSWLSPEYSSIEDEIRDLVFRINKGDLIDKVALSSSLRFGYEIALKGIENANTFHIYGNRFFNDNKKLPTNGLIWMGNKDFMSKQVEAKLNEGFTTLKMKIGAIGLETELDILKSLRKRYSVHDLTLRVDANGAFECSEALEVLGKLEALQVHSIEQPIKPGQIADMAQLVKDSPIPIALDEELIGVKSRQELISNIRPHYIILKPSLHGGLSGCEDWIKIAKEHNVKYWMTSALESNIGLNAICQFAAEWGIDIPQGLGTGQLYHNNIVSPITLTNGFTYYDSNKKWELNPINSLFEQT